MGGGGIWYEVPLPDVPGARSGVRPHPAFPHGITNATREGINGTIQTFKLVACRYQNRNNYKTAIYFHGGGLDLYPHPEAF